MCMYIIKNKIFLKDGKYIGYLILYGYFEKYIYVDNMK